MSDDALISANEREIFEAIVSDLVDPELARLHRIFLALSAVLFVLGALGVTIVGRLGWAGLGSFSVTFLSGLLLARRVYAQRFFASARR
jgi:small-conductance mechanosensitive channel